MKTMYDYGLSKIYELVINTNPCYAFLLDTNQVLQNTLVAAHVLGHSDFFKNNAYFSRTNRQMLESVGVHAERLRRYEFEHGIPAVEEFLDAVLAIQAHVDPLPHRRRVPERDRRRERERPTERSTPYDDLFVLDRRGDAPAPATAPPPAAEEDLLLFLIEHGRSLEDWQRDVIAIVREEALFFLPQMQTKIMNEGWASLWHARILRAMELPPDEHVEFARLHSGVLSPSRRQLNPYYLGYQMWEHIERRLNDGADWTPEMIDSPGTRAIFEIRALESDVSFVRNYLDAELVERADLYLYQLEGDAWTIVERDHEKIRDQLARMLSTYGTPRIVVADGDHDGNGELKLRHCYEGSELDLPYAQKTLEYLHRLWGRRVHLETVLEEKPVTLSYDPRRGHQRA
jgi:stage V sporulation protein R